ncbi:glutathione S-transferase [Fennellomyces sp. T-0311]|nr:glutathione S-transferase [Fennellomyces sp. T-0311]
MRDQYNNRIGFPASFSLQSAQKKNEMAHIIFYDLELEGIPGQAWSPNTCKTRFALNYKGIPYETVWLKFPQVREEVPKITGNSKAVTVPVIVDKLHGNKAVHESWEIAKYLDEAYPDTPSLFNGNIGAHLFFHDFVSRRVLAKIFKLSVFSILEKAQQHGPWFRATREASFKMPLEKFVGDQDKNAKAITENIDGIGRVLKQYPYVTGQQPGWADVSLASYFIMLKVHRPEIFQAIVLNDPKAGKEFTAWWSRMDKYIQLAPPPADARI